MKRQIAEMEIGKLVSNRMMETLLNRPLSKKLDSFVLFTLEGNALTFQKSGNMWELIRKNI